MSTAQTNRGRFVIETAYTRDVKVPLVDGDDDLDRGWRCIPVAPAPFDETWEIFDNSKDYKTGWLRVKWEAGT
jgi:hypothetical protein